MDRDRDREIESEEVSLLSTKMLNKSHKTFPASSTKINIIFFKISFCGARETNLDGQCRSEIRLHILCSLILMYTVREMSGSYM